MTQGELPRRLRWPDAAAIVVGSMIGSGIFLKASAIAKLLPDPRWVLAVWVISGLLTFFGALAFAELGAARPRAGGLYVYLHDAYGPLMGYLFGWSLLAVLQTGSIAGLAAGVAQTLSGLYDWSDATEIGVAGLLIVAVSLVHLVSTRAGANLQNLLTVTKCAGILVLMGGGFFLARGTLANLLPEAPQALPVGLAGAFGLAMVKALWAYDGWVNATFMAGEVKDPQRSLPRALLLGTGAVTVIYVLTNAAYHYALPVADVQAAKSVAVTVAERMAGLKAALAMAALTAISMAGTLNSSAMSGPRVYYAMARDGLFLPALGALHPRFRTPYVAVIVQCFWALALLAWWGTFERLTDNVVFVYFLFYALGAGAVLIERRRRPDRELPYRTPGYPVVPLIFVATAAWLTVNTLVQAPRDALQALGLLGLGLLLYPLMRRRAD